MVKFKDRGPGWFNESRNHAKAGRGQKVRDPMKVEARRSAHAIAVNKGLQAKKQYPRRGPFGSWPHDPNRSDVQGIDSARRIKKQRTISGTYRNSYITLKTDFKRNKYAEDGRPVVRWFEDKKGNVISVMHDPDIPRQGIIRWTIDGKNGEVIASRYASLESMSDAEIIKRISDYRKEGQNKIALL